MSASRGAALLALLAWALYVPSAAAEQCQGGSWDASGDVDLLIRSAAAESSALCVGGGCAAGSSAARIHSLLLRAEAALDAQPAPGPAEGGGSADAEGGEWEAAAPADTRRESACSSLQGEIERLRSRIQDADSWNRISYEIEGEEARQRREDVADADSAENGPKEIVVQCQQGAVVRVVDLPDAAREQNQCLVFSLSAPDVTSRLTVYCDGRFESDGLEGDAQ